MNLRFSPEAIDDLVRLRAFVEEKNPAVAQRIAKELLLGLEKLKAFPEIGLKVGRAFEPLRIRDFLLANIQCVTWWERKNCSAKDMARQNA